MAPVTAAAAARPTAEDERRSTGFLLLAACALGVLLAPGAVAGAALAWLVWRDTREPHATRWLYALLGAGCAVCLSPFVVLAWPWRLLVGAPLSGIVPQFTPIPAGGLPAVALMHSMAVEALLGPMALLVARHALRMIDTPLQAEIRWGRDQRRQEEQQAERQDAWQASGGPPPLPANVPHPAGRIRLGVDAGTRRPLDLRVDRRVNELGRHVFLPGAFGAGKTTTIARLCDGALANGYAVVIVDCKAGPLADMAEMLATRHAVPFHLVHPDAEDSLGYNPCVGAPAEIADKIAGAFDYSGGGEVYKYASMRVATLAVEALEETADARRALPPGDPLGDAHPAWVLADGAPVVTLEALQQVLAPGGFAELSALMEGSRRYALDAVDEERGVSAQGRSGFYFRLGTLLTGKFGPLFRKQPALDWHAATAAQSVTYVGLPTLASPEHVDLMGRVVAQDLKQLCAQRFAAIRRGEPLVPVLAVIDEFAALRDAEQIVDLLLQAREARMPVIVSTQQMPENERVSEAVRQAGLIIAHRVTGGAVEPIAAEFGTRRRIQMTYQTGEDGSTGMGSAREAHEYNVSPNELRNLAAGFAKVRVVGRGEHATVQVYPTLAEGRP